MIAGLLNRILNRNGPDQLRRNINRRLRRNERRGSIIGNDATACRLDALIRGLNGHSKITRMSLNYYCILIIPFGAGRSIRVRIENTKTANSYRRPLLPHTRQRLLRAQILTVASSGTPCAFRRR